jgi:hypothetical protein
MVKPHALLQLVCTNYTSLSWIEEKFFEKIVFAQLENIPEDLTITSFFTYHQREDLDIYPS